MAVVKLVWCSIGVPALTDNEYVWALAEWVGENSNGSEVDIGVVAWGLASRAAVEVPFWKVIDGKLAALWDLGEGLQKKSKVSYDLVVVRATARNIGNVFPTFDLERTPLVESIQMYLFVD